MTSFAFLNGVLDQVLEKTAGRYIDIQHGELPTLAPSLLHGTIAIGNADGHFHPAKVQELSSSEGFCSRHSRRAVSHAPKLSVQMEVGRGAISNNMEMLTNN